MNLSFKIAQLLNWTHSQYFQFLSKVESTLYFFLRFCKPQMSCKLDYLSLNTLDLWLLFESNEKGLYFLTDAKFSKDHIKSFTLLLLLQYIAKQTICKFFLLCVIQKRMDRIMERSSLLTWLYHFFIPMCVCVHNITYKKLNIIRQPGKKMISYKKKIPWNFNSIFFYVGQTNGQMCIYCGNVCAKCI